MEPATGYFLRNIFFHDKYEGGKMEKGFLFSANFTPVANREYTSG